MTVVADQPKTLARPRLDAGATPMGAIRTILVHVRGDRQDGPRLAAAAALARRIDAKIIGLGCEMVPPLAVGDSMGLMEGEWIVEMRKLVQSHLQEAREAFEAATAGLRTEWLWTEDMPAQALARVARAADLIVAGGHPLDDTDRYRQASATELMLTAGGPVLVAPPEGGALKAQIVVVAWKDSREARRALADSLPFLKAAESVRVVEVCSAGEQQDAVDRTQAVVGRLERHGVSAHAKVVIAPPENVALELNRAAEVLGADLIVTGGYGHSRLREWVLGGVTRDLMRQPERFVLFSH
jgi:nucleotide-binding universal stress UspA family protein